jgi:hypothetical protein
MDLPVADDRQVLRNVFDTAKILSTAYQDRLTDEQLRGSDPKLFRTVFDHAMEESAPELTLPDEVAADIRKRPVRRVRFTNVFGDDPTDYLSGLRTRRGRPKFTIGTLLDQDTDQLISRAMNPHPTAILRDNRIVVPYGYKTDAESRLRDHRTRWYPYYRQSQLGIDELNREIPERLQSVYEGYTPREVQESIPAMVYDGMFGFIRRGGRVPLVRDVNEGIRNAVNNLIYDYRR